MLNLFVNFYLQSIVPAISLVSPKPITGDLVCAHSQDDHQPLKIFSRSVPSSSGTQPSRLPHHLLPSLLLTSLQLFLHCLAPRQACHVAPIRCLQMRNQGDLLTWFYVHHSSCSFPFLNQVLLCAKKFTLWLHRNLRFWIPSLWNLKQRPGKIEKKKKKLSL